MFRDFNLQIPAGQRVGLVGMSGAGKTTLTKLLLRLADIQEGEILVDGQNVADVTQQSLRRQIAYVPQEALLFHRSIAENIAYGRPDATIEEIREAARAANALEFIEDLPQGFDTITGERGIKLSGGQRQRIGIARALAIEPEFIVCDEPISALDVSIQSQIINLLHDLQQQLGLTFLFIAHDLNIVKYISDRIAVMYLGNVVELASSDDLYAHTLHPYSKALLSAVPIPDPSAEAQKHRQILSGDVPSPINTPKGCNFAGRCPVACDKCRESKPQLREIRPGHFCACHLVEPEI